MVKPVREIVERTITDVVRTALPHDSKFSVLRMPSSGLYAVRIVLPNGQYAEQSLSAEIPTILDTSYLVRIYETIGEDTSAISEFLPDSVPARFIVSDIDELRNVLQYKKGASPEFIRKLTDHLTKRLSAQENARCTPTVEERTRIISACEKRCSKTEPIDPEDIVQIAFADRLKVGSVLLVSEDGHINGTVAQLKREGNKKLHAQPYIPTRSAVGYRG